MWNISQLLAILLILIANFLSFTQSKYDGPHWVKFNPTTDTLPTDAIVGGYENETLYIARAPHEGSLTPGKYVPSTQKATISWGRLSYVKTKFEILCGDNYKWVPTTTANIPAGAVVAGHVQSSFEPLYVGRVNYSDQIIPGKVAVSNGAFYFAHGEKEISVENFEILVETKKTIEPTSDEGPHWVKYNPTTEALPSDAIVGGYEDETLYIARAPHEGSLTPGKYVPSTHKAIISWGGLSHEKTEFEILCGGNYEWVTATTANIPAEAVVGGHIQDTYEQLYVGRVNYFGQIIPGKVARSQGVLYFANGEKEITVTNFEVLVATKKIINGDPHWIQYNPDTTALPTDAIVGGYEHETLYIARAPHEGSLTPGKYVPSTHKAFISWGRLSHIKTEFEILCGKNYKWFPTTTANIPSGAVIGGYVQNSYEPLYVGRVIYSGQIIPGKVARSHEVFYFAYGNEEISVEDFEILVVAEKLGELQFSVEQEDTTFDWAEKEDHELNCDVQANPKADIIWMWNGRVLDNQKSSRLALFGNWGQYICKASNIHGTIERSFNVTSSKCIIPRVPKYVNTAPLILNTTGSWPQLDYTKDYLKVDPGQTLTFSCPSFENETNSFLELPVRNEVIGRCDKEDIFIIKDQSYKLSDLACAQAVEAVVVKKHEKCLTETSELLRVGYDIHGFLETYEVCFDTAKNISLYTRMVISKSNSGRGLIYDWYQYPGIGDVQYNPANTCSNTTSTCCYTKTQLVNTRDVSDGPAQRSTFIDPINAVMQWRPCDLPLSHWEVLEDFVRALTRLKDQFKVWSGTHLLQDKNGTVIPRLLWKAIENSVAIVYINGPSPTAEDVLCTNICDDNSLAWPSEYNKHFYCCLLENFLQGFGLYATNLKEQLQDGTARDNADTLLIF